MKWNRLPTWDIQDSCEFEGDLLITDPCYLWHGVESQFRSWDEFSDPIIGNGGMQSNTYYGDWGCTVFKSKSGEVGIVPKKSTKRIGRFCADAGMVCVVKLADVLEANPGFAEWLKAHDGCATVIKGFKGTVKFITSGHWDTELRVHGEGVKDGKPFCFESLQTEA